MKHVNVKAQSDILSQVAETTGLTVKELSTSNV